MRLNIIHQNIRSQKLTLQQYKIILVTKNGRKFSSEEYLINL